MSWGWDLGAPQPPSWGGPEDLIPRPFNHPHSIGVQPLSLEVSILLRHQNGPNSDILGFISAPAGAIFSPSIFLKMGKQMLQLHFYSFFCISKNFFTPVTPRARNDPPVWDFAVKMVDSVLETTQKFFILIKIFRILKKIFPQCLGGPRLVPQVGGIKVYD